MAASDLSDLRLSLCLPALDITTPLILERVDAAIAGSRFDAERDSVQIALAEVLNNVVEHGYGTNSFGAVAMRVGCADGALSITVTDWGTPYPNHNLPEGVPPEPDQLSEGGYGWFLIKSLMTQVTYHRQAHSNHLRLSLSV